MSADNVRSIARQQPAPPALRPDNLDTLTVARMLAESGFFGEVRDAGKALAKILAGQELGMGPIASLMGVYYQQGKVTYSANIMAAAIKRSGTYNYRIRRHENDGCEIEFFERGESLGTSAFTREDAKQAGLLDGPNKHNWTKFPRNMYFARAMSNGAKWFCPDIFGGMTPYTPDELGAEVAEDGAPTVVDVTPAIETCDKPRYLKAWHAAVKGTRFEDEATRHKFVAWYTQGRDDSLGAFLDRAGREEADDLVAAIKERIADEAKKAARASAGPKVEAAAALTGAPVAAEAIRPTRTALVATLRQAVKRANDAGGDFEVPSDLARLSDDDVQQMIDAADAVVGKVAEAQ